jgi:hypothetical protein
LSCLHVCFPPQDLPPRSSQASYSWCSFLLTTVCRWRAELSSFFFFFFWRHWSLNSRPCEASALPLEPLLQP